MEPNGRITFIIHRESINMVAVFLKTFPFWGNIPRKKILKRGVFDLISHGEKNQTFPIGQKPYWGVNYIYKTTTFTLKK